MLQGVGCDHTHRHCKKAHTKPLTVASVQADLAGRDFAGERGKAVVVSTGAAASTAPVDAADGDATRAAAQARHAAALRVPQRPQWSAEMSTSEVHAREEAMFLAWRRKLALCASAYTACARHSELLIEDCACVCLRPRASYMHKCFAAPQHL
jgi:hypothetical protein